MKKRLVLAAGLIATAGAVFGVVGGGHTAGAAGRDVPSTGKALTYEQALAVHDPQAEATKQVTAQEAARGLPMCANTNQQGGYKSLAALQAALAAAREAPTCYTDPHDALFVPFGTCDITSFPSAADAAQIMNEQRKAGCPSGSDRRSASEPGVYTFDQAVKAGLVPSLATQEQISGLPLCKPGGTGGYKSAAALKAAAAKAPEAPTCMADPRLATYSVGGPAPPGIPTRP